MDKIGVKDLGAIREGAIAAFNDLPSRCRLKGMVTDLTESDKLVLAWTVSVMTHLNRVGATPPGLTLDFFPAPFTEVQEVISEETYGTSIKGAKP
jgi:hypothetical protein